MTSWPPPADGEPTYPAEEPYPGGSPYPGSPPYPAGPPFPGGYPHPAPYPYPYPPPGSYGWPPAAPRRPGTLTAAAVLGYVDGGLIILAAVLLFAAAASGGDLDYSITNGHSLTAELTVDGLLNLIAGGLLIGGAVAMTAGRPLGRLLYSTGAGVVLAESVYWMTRWSSQFAHIAGLLVYALLFAAVAIVGLSLAWVREGSEWLRVSRR